MHIGVFTAKDNEARLKELLQTKADVNFELFSYKSIEEVIDAFKKQARFLDGYLFSGYLAYMTIKAQLGNYEKPATYLKLSEADFYKKLTHILLKNKELDLSRVFLDFHVESDEIALAVNKLPEENRPLLAGEEHIYFSEDIYERALSLHEKYHQEGKVDVSFTRFVNLCDKLEEKNVPYYYFDISDETILKTADQLIKEVNVEFLKDNQVICGAIKFRVDEAKIVQRKEQILKSLSDFNANKHYDLIFHEQEDYIEIMTNFLEVEMLTNNFKSCSLLHALQKQFKEPIHIGWGVGKTVAQARINAQVACDYSYNNDTSSTYVMLDEGEMIGPLLGRKAEKDSVVEIFSAEEIIELTNRLNMTRDKLNKIFLVFNNIENEQINSTLFAEKLGLSVRSANRILKEAEEKKLVISEIDSAAGLQGRPRKLYRLNREIL